MAAAVKEYQTPEPFEVPEGGLASFLTATVGDWAEADNDEYIPQTGIAQVKDIADKLAEYGRYEDEYMVHAAEGETVIPAEVLDANPRLKAKLFHQMREMGIDPERYIVGNELNSINPVTGQPEFFLKKIFKGVKKLVKGVVKVFKKVAPIVLSAVGMAVLGPIGAGLGSGIGTLIQGGSLKDALKNGLISGVTAGIGQGLSEGFSAAKAGAETGLGNIGEFASGFGQSVSEGLKGGYIDQFTAGMSNLSSSAKAVMDNFGASEATDVGVASPSELVEQARALPGQQQTVGFSGADEAALRSMQSGANPDVLQPIQVTAQRIPTTQPTQYADFSAADEAVLSSMSEGAGAAQPQSYFERLKSDPLGTLTGSSAQPTNQMLAARQTQLMNQFGLGAKDALTMAQEQLAPSLLQKYGTAAALATGLGAATGAFEAQPVEPVDYFGGVTGWDLLEQNPEKYRVGLPTYGQPASMGMPSVTQGSSLEQFGPNVTTAQVTGQAPKLIGYDSMGNPVYEEQQPNPYINPMYQAPVGAAMGGKIESFPRRMGAIYGPGTETSDDIPAMLSDGEFVMTARAVRGAGDGDRERGMMRMYEIMRKFEGGRV